MDIKAQLYSYYLDILNEIANYSSEKMCEFKNISFENMNISELLDKIKEATSELINLKVANSENSKGYSQLENYAKKLEYDIRIYHKKYFEYKIQNNALEDKIKIYRIIHEEFENLKEKVKYDGGKFLNNERKENEIIILRQENNILKKEVAKLENLNKLNETLKNNYLNKIKNLQNEIDKLNKKFETKYNSNNINNIRNFNTSNASNINININNNENILSKCIYKYDLNNANNNNNETHKNSYNYLNNIKNLFKKTNKRPANYNLIKNIYMNSNNFRNNINSSTINTINSNIFTSNYNRIINNVSSKNKNKNSTKQNYSTIKNKIQNNSISMKIDKDEDKSVSLNKYIKSNDNKFSYESDRKIKKSFSKISSFKSTDNGPMSCQNKSSSKIRKYLNKKIGSNNNDFRMKKNNSALNIKVNSK